jgi:hypothetical protein
MLVSFPIKPADLFIQYLQSASPPLQFGQEHSTDRGRFTGFGVANSNTPLPSVSEAWNSTCPASLLIAPDVVAWIGGGGTTSCGEDSSSTVPTPGITGLRCASGPLPPYAAELD